jgi:hypothetical protein
MVRTRIEANCDQFMLEEKSAAPIGFLTAKELPSSGFCGGLLLLNDRGRPLEFHCNAPIRPSRTQEILYGATLRPFLLTEAIAVHLVEKCSRAPGAILTDVAELWELDRQISSLLVWIPSESNRDQPSAGDSFVDHWVRTEIAGQSVGLTRRGTDRREELEAAIGEFARRLPLLEPFQRIQQAIEEAHSISQLRESA